MKFYICRIYRYNFCDMLASWLLVWYIGQCFSKWNPWNTCILGVLSKMQAPGLSMSLVSQILWLGVRVCMIHSCAMQFLRGIDMSYPQKSCLCHPHGRAAWSSWFLILVWPISGYCKHLGNEPVDGRFLFSFSVSLCYSILPIVEDKDKH